VGYCHGGRSVNGKEYIKFGEKVVLPPGSWEGAWCFLLEVGKENGATLPVHLLGVIEGKAPRGSSRAPDNTLAGFGSSELRT
jgi:hypothetical protein